MKPFGKQFKIKINIIPHWRIFDLIEYPNGTTEVSIFFIKILSGNRERISYYLDTCGLGLELITNKIQAIINVKLIAFTLQFIYIRKHKLRIER